jgi:hypothetical protein
LQNTLSNYKEDQFANIVKNHESTQPNMNSIIKTAAKIKEELSQPNEKSDAKQDGIQDTKAKLEESLIYSTFTLVLSEVCVQCPIWLFSVVP